MTNDKDVSAEQTNNEEQCDHGTLFLYVTMQVAAPIQHNSAFEVSQALDSVKNLVQGAGYKAQTENSFPVHADDQSFDLNEPKTELTDEETLVRHLIDVTMNDPELIAYSSQIAKEVSGTVDWEDWQWEQNEDTAEYDLFWSINSEVQARIMLQVAQGFLGRYGLK